MSTITLIGHLAGVPAVTLAAPLALRTAMRVVLEAVATFGHGQLRTQALEVLRIVSRKRNM